MAIKSIIADGGGDGYSANVHKRNGDRGLVVFTSPLKEREPVTAPALNDDYGDEMAQAVTFGGTPELIHNGGDSVGWTGTGNAGTWDFADTTNPNTGSFCFSVTSANTGDNASLTDATETVMSGYTTITGSIQLDNYTSANHTIVLQFRNNGVNVGNSVNIDDYIDTTTLGSYQGFIISKSQFGIGVQTVDELLITVERSGGSRPTFRIDDLQIEETGSPLEFEISPTIGTKYYVYLLEFTFIDALDMALLNNSVPNLSYDKLLAETSLGNGVGIRRIRNGDVVFSSTFKNLGDTLKEGAEIKNLICDGTNTFLTIKRTFFEPLVLDSRTSDKISVLINDNLTGLISFTALAEGEEEKIPITSHRIE